MQLEKAGLVLIHIQGSYVILNINFQITFSNDIPSSNTGPLIVNTMKVKLSVLNKIS